MDRPPSLTVDFKKINAFTSERDLKLWKQQAIAKYYKAKYEEIRKQNEISDEKTSKYEQSINQIEEEIPKKKALQERMVMSISTVSAATDYLIQLGIYMENDRVATKNRYEKMVNQYSNMYKHQRKSLQQSNVVYKELEVVQNSAERVRIEKEVLCRSVEDKRKMIQIKMDVNKQVLNSEIIKFVQAFMRQQEHININKEIADQRQLAHEFVKLYEKQQSIEQSLTQKEVKRKELPKLSIEITGLQELANFSIPKMPTMETPQTKVDIKSKNEELLLLNELKKRSDQRKKIIQEQQTALFTSKRKRSQEQPPKKIETPPNTNTSVKPNVAEKTNPIKPPSNVVILQNETLDTNNNAALKKKNIKRPSSSLEPPSKSKKSKKVSFGNCFSQEDQILNTTVNGSQNKNEVVSSYFSNIDNVNMFQPQTSFLNAMDEFMPSQDFYQEDNASENMKDLMISKDDEKSLELSTYKSFDNSQLSTLGLF